MAANSIWASISASSRSSSSSESLKRASSLYSHQLSRNLAKIAVDSVNLAGALRKGLAEDDVQTGDFYTSITADLGEKDYNRLCEDKGLALVKIHYCQRGLEHLGEHLDKKTLKEGSGKSDLSDADVEEIKKMKARAVINHDYLVLELQRGDSSGETFYILAEKLGRGGNRGQAGIFIYYKPAEQAESFLLNNNTKLYVIDCGKKHIRLDTLIGILKKVDPDYSLRNANCWDYATATTKRLVLESAEGTGTSAEEKARLKKEHDNLEANLNNKNMHNIAKAVIAWVSKTTSAIS